MTPTTLTGPAGTQISDRRTRSRSIRGVSRCLIIAASAAAVVASVAQADTATATVTLTPGALTVTKPALRSATRVAGGWQVAVSTFNVVDAAGSGAGWHLDMRATTASGAAVSVTMPVPVDVYKHDDPGNAATSVAGSPAVSAARAVVAFAAPNTGLGTFSLTGASLFVAGATKPTGLEIRLTVVSGG